MRALLGLVFFLVVSPASALTLGELIAQRERWPAEVTVTAAARGTVLREGRPGGAMLLGAGRTLAVVEIAADGLVGRIGDAVVKVPIEKTDLLQRAGATAAEAAAPAPAAPPAATSPAVATPANAAAASTRRVPPMMERLLADKLVRLDGARVKPVANSALEGVRYYALYYSASWCGPCREFTPQLVRAYRELKARHPEFELVFVSADRSADDMAAYMRHDAMPWPAVNYDRRDNKITSYAGPGIPCLVFVDEKGRVLSDSYEGDNYVGPQKVLRDVRRILGG